MTPEEREHQGVLLNSKGWELHQQGFIDDAVCYYLKAISYQNTTAMINLGNIYEAREEYEKAYECYLEAALGNDLVGEFNVANMHFWGWHVKQDYQKAYKYFESLYKKGVEGVCLYMGLYAENGYLGEKDYPKAVMYYREGVDRGETECPVNLGRMFCLGLGVEQDYQKGFEYYLLGYEQGDTLACANIGYCYEVGQGVEKDMNKALFYYRQGAEQEEEHCIEALERLEQES